MPEQPRLNGAGAGVARAIPLGDDWISRRLRELDERITQNLAAMRVMVDPLAQAINDLQAQQATLAAQQASITVLVNQQVAGANNSAFASGLSLTSSQSSVAATSVTVPAEFTIADVIAVSALAAGSGIAVNCTTRIQGGDGGMLTGVAGVASSAHARTLTGLSGGGTITASTLAASIPNTSTAMANTLIFAMFRR